MAPTRRTPKARSASPRSLVPALVALGVTAATLAPASCAGDDAAVSPGATASTGSGSGGATGGAGGAGGSGGGGASGTGGAPWSAPVERCGDGLDDDLDGLADEDCPPSLFGGVYVPEAGGDFAGAGLTAALEAASARPIAVVQTYRTMTPLGIDRMVEDLEAIWAHGAVPHVNVEPSGYSAAQYAAPGSDPAIGADLDAVALALAGALAGRPDGRLFLTFGAEANGDWTDWGCLAPATFQSFHHRAHEAVAAALAEATPPIDPRRVRWVFGPNSTSSAGCGAAAAYYPGHADVDLLGMSAYRSGTQTVGAAVIAPAKALLDDLGFPEAWREDRFVVLQTGSRDEPGDDRGAWVSELYASLAADPVFAGVIYFDAADWAILAGTQASPIELEGYSAWTAALGALPLADAGLEATFEPFFWDVPRAATYYPEVQALRAAGLISGCGVEPPRFCPDDELTRADAAVLMARAFALAPGGGPPLFEDVPAGAPAFGAVQALVTAGALDGCGASTFCPGDPIARADLALGLAKLAGAGAPPAAEAFGDLGALGADADPIEALAAVGWVDGCAPGAFCPGDPALRSAGAAWIVRAAPVAPAPPL